MNTHSNLPLDKTLWSVCTRYGYNNMIHSAPCWMAIEAEGKKTKGVTSFKQLIERFSYDLEISVRYFFHLFLLSDNEWKDQNRDSSFSLQRKPYCGEGIVRLANRVAVWRQSEVSIDFQKVLGHEVFSSARSLNQPKATSIYIRLINQSNRSISVRLLFLFCSRVFISS